MEYTARRMEGGGRRQVRKEKPKQQGELIERETLRLEGIKSSEKREEDERRRRENDRYATPMTDYQTKGGGKKKP